MNALNFPAAMLQPPYFDPTRPAVIDYGATGPSSATRSATASTTRRALRRDGRLHNWWTPEDLAHFKAPRPAHQAVQRLPAVPRPRRERRADRRENIADVAGLAVAYDAYRASLDGSEAPAVRGLTGDQQFFLAFAQSWRTRLASRRCGGACSPNRTRPPITAPLTVRNLDAWYAAFDVEPGAPSIYAGQWRRSGDLAARKTRREGVRAVVAADSRESTSSARWHAACCLTTATMVVPPEVSIAKAAAHVAPCSVSSSRARSRRAYRSCRSPGSTASARRC